MATYDSVVVGGGSAGSVLAARLSEDRSERVLLLEAGRDWRSDDADADLRSANFLRLVTEGRFLWSGLEATLTPAQGPRPYLVGRGLGGGSTVNAQFWARPQPADFEAWVEQGCAGWDPASMRPVLNAVESDPDFGDRPYHGADGPIPVWRPRTAGGHWGPLDEALQDALRSAGHPVARDMDLNAPGRTGVVEAAYNRSDAGRVTTNDAYLDPARSRDNLDVRGETLVDRVVFDGHEATGVDAVGPDGEQTYEADRVILAAGAIFTPAILVRSGIGPRSQLDEIGVDARSIRPGLGRLLDHPQLSITFPLAESARLDAPTGPAARVGAVWSSSLDEARSGDLHVLSQHYRGVGASAVETGGLLFGLTDVFSEGRVRVRTDDPTAMPDVSVGMLTDERDLERAVAAVKHLREVLETTAMADIADGSPGLVRDPGETVPLADLSTEAAAERAILACVDSYDHPAGTCRMGDPEDRLTVVDPGGAVVGVEDLHVADASVMPGIVSVQTNYAAIAIAERIARDLAA